MTDEGWRALEEGRLEDADRLWSELIASAENSEQRDRYIGHHAYVLVAQRRFDEARAAYRGLCERDPSHRHVHQLGMVEREAGNLTEALGIFEREAELLPEGDALALAANLYERGLLHHLLQQPGVSFGLMEQCVAAAERSVDATMRGCAYRLKGDVLAAGDTAQARTAYARARGCFAEAGDAFGVAEIERRVSRLPR